MDAASALIGGLGGERVRWTSQSKEFKEQTEKYSCLFAYFRCKPVSGLIDHFRSTNNKWSYFSFVRNISGFINGRLWNQPITMHALDVYDHVRSWMSRLVWLESRCIVLVWWHYIPSMCHQHDTSITLCRLIGDVLLCTGFLSYSGPFNQEFRNKLLEKWMKELSQRRIPFSLELSLTSSLVDNTTVTWSFLTTLPYF